MKKTFLALFLIFIGFAAYSQPKMIQQTTINDFSIRWIHDTKGKVDFIELSKSPKFDDIVYRFVTAENSGIEFIIPQIEASYKMFSKGIKIEDSFEISSTEFFSLGLMLSLFVDNVDFENTKRLFDLDWCKCLCVYNDFDVYGVYSDLTDIIPSF